MFNLKVLKGLLIAISIIVLTIPQPILADSIPTSPDPPLQPVNTTTPPPEPQEPSAPTQTSPTTSTDTAGQTGGTIANTSTGTAGSATPPPNPSPTSGVVGDTTINTGTATNSTSAAVVANTNVSNNNATPSADGSNLVNNSNGSSSSSNNQLQSNSTATTSQTNGASVENNLTKTTSTGSNLASNNVGNSLITTGDANTSGVALTAVNTNANNVSVAEFNVADNHVGDLTLNFADNCVLGCSGQVNSTNTGNGSGSSNSNGASLLTNSNTFQSNDANLANNLTLASNSGDNVASKNTGGTSTIQTGNANVSATALTLANNNLSGKVDIGVVNIYGNLVGDIILPESQVNQSCNCVTSSDLSNSLNGSGSNNSNNLALTNNNTTTQTNLADINNSLNLSATTGSNDADKNTGGNSAIQTGNSLIVSNVLNLANSNIDGGNVWLVLINQAGQWVGQLLGGSSNATVTTAPNGDITLNNTGNGSGSSNSNNLSLSSSNTTTQNNNLHLSNTLNLSANTGSNIASDNTGGPSSISTGDAKIIASIINFVNNNITGNSHLVVTIVSVFGSWLGDFVTPGSQKQSHTGGPSTAQAQITNASQSNQTTSQSQGFGISTPILASVTVTDGNNAILPKTIFHSTAVLGIQTPTTSSSNQNSALLAGFKTISSNPLVVTHDTNQKKIVHINMALFALLLPFVGMGIAVKRRYG